MRENLSRQLRALITDGAYQPGDHMTERELCGRLRASRPSVRETLRQLAAEGLLEIFPNRGAVVRTLGVDTFLQLWEVRLALETLAAERMARCGDAEQIERFETAIRQMEIALRSKDRKKIKIARGEMFESFASGGGNDMLAAYIRQIDVRLSFLWSSSSIVNGQPAESIDVLRVLLSAVKSRNPEAARAAIILYNEHARAVAMYALRAFEESKERKEA